ncbi:MAG: dethiobiotin synthase [Thermosynechococcaceae cyanobacterium]
MSTLLISGSDTNAGKTVVTSALMAYRQRYLADQNWAICKPLQSGTGDREHYQSLFDLSQPPTTVNPLYFEQPLAPPIAAAQEGKEIHLDLAWQALSTLQQSYDHVLVEGLGGLGSPITRELTVADLARDWRLPTVLIIPVQLGSIGQAVANVALARQRQVLLRGIILNGTTPLTPEQIDHWTPIELLHNLTQTPVLGIMPYLKDPTQLEALAQAAAQLDLESLLPSCLPRLVGA